MAVMEARGLRAPEHECQASEDCRAGRRLHGKLDRYRRHGLRGTRPSRVWRWPPPRRAGSAPSTRRHRAKDARGGPHSDVRASEQEQHRPRDASGRDGRREPGQVRGPDPCPGDTARASAGCRARRGEQRRSRSGRVRRASRGPSTGAALWRRGEGAREQKCRLVGRCVVGSAQASRTGSWMSDGAAIDSEWIRRCPTRYVPRETSAGEAPGPGRWCGNPRSVLTALPEGVA